MSSGYMYSQGSLAVIIVYAPDVLLVHIKTTGTQPHHTNTETNDLQRHNIPVQNQHDPLNTEYSNLE